METELLPGYLLRALLEIRFVLERRDLLQHRLDLVKRLLDAVFVLEQPCVLALVDQRMFRVTAAGDYLYLPIVYLARIPRDDWQAVTRWLRARLQQQPVMLVIRHGDELLTGSNRD